MKDRYPYELRPAADGDREELVALHNAAYAGDDGHGLNPVDAGVWDWRYGADGVGHASSVAADRESGSIAAFVGGVPLRLWLRGEVTSGVLSLDLMTSPSRSRGLRRVGVFGRLVHYWCDHYFSPLETWFGFGFPSTRAFRIGRRFGGYRLLRPVNVLVHERPGALFGEVGGLEAVEVERVSADADALWTRTAGDIELGVVRDAAYFGHRYSDHPRLSYRLVEVRETAGGRLRGVVVTRRGGIAEDGVMLMDLLVPEDDQDAIRCLMNACADAADQYTAGAILAWFPEGLRWFERLQDLGFRVRTSPIIHVGRSWRRDISVEEVRRINHMTFGDIEYF